MQAQRVPDKVLQWLHNSLKPQYVSVDRTYSDVAKTLSEHPSLSPRTEVFTFENGASALLLVLGGTLAVPFRGATYKFPLALWIPHAYPHEPPMVYVTPTSGMAIRPGQHVSIEGQVYHPYLAHWRDHWNVSNIIDMLAIFRGVFAKEPPVVSRQQQAPPQPKSPQDRLPQRSGSQTLPLEHGARPLSTNQPAQQSIPPPPPPPKPPEASVSPARPQVASRANLDTGATASIPPRLPPKPPVANGSSYGTRAEPPREHRSPERYSTSTVQHQPDLARSYEVLPPRESVTASNQYQDTLRRSVAVAEPSRMPPQIQTHNEHPIPLANTQWQSPSGQPQLRYPPSQFPSQHPNALSHSFPVNARKPIEDLLSGAPEEAQSGLEPAASQAPPIPPNPEKDAIAQAISSALASRHAQAVRQNNAAIPALLSQHAAMQQAYQNMQNELSQLQSLDEMLSSNEKILHEAMREADRVTESIGRREVPKVDDVLVAPTVVGEQLYGLVADVRGISDTMFALTRALDKGRVGADVFIKQTRTLARERFFKEALIKKISNGMGLATE